MSILCDGRLTILNLFTIKGMMMTFKKLQQDKKSESKVERPLGFDERAPLSAFSQGMEVTGVVISMTNFGVYVDVGTECDGLLHVSQMTRDFFVEHPRQLFTPGDEVTVKVKSTSTELKKMHLTMLNVKADETDDDDDEERIPLTEIEADDELWGVLKRVTDFGSFVEVGAEVDGFMHFMDHPSWENGSHPSEFMVAGQRVRVWVVDVNRDQRRVKLTGNRPTHLPGPRVEF
jgi:small subunit ribosomal protein S1